MSKMNTTSAQRLAMLNPTNQAAGSALAAGLLKQIVDAPPAANAPLNERISHMLDIVTKGGVKKPGRDLLVQPFTFWQKIAWSNSALQYEFLQSGQSTFSCNWPQAGQLPNTMGFALARLGVWADTGYTLSTGAQDTAGSQGAASATPMAIAEMLRIFHEQALVQLSVGPRTIAQDFAVKFPRGAGPAATAAISNSNANTANQIAFANNGAPADIHRDTFPDYFPIGPGESVKLTVSLPSALTLPNAAVGVVCVSLEGYKIEEAR
jgi:hypothetical protein